MSEPNSVSAVSARASSGASGGASPLSEQVRSLRLPPADYRGARTAWLPWLLCLILAGSTGWFGYKLYFTSAATETTAPTDRPVTPAAEMKLAAAHKAAAVGEIALESKGYITAAHQILVSPQVSGRLLMLNVEEGRRAMKGEVLGEIESTEYRADVARAEASLELAKQRLLELRNGNRPEEIEQSQAELAESEATLKQLEAEWKRNSQLVKTNIVTEQEFEVTESKYRAMQRRVERLRFALKLMKDGPREERIEVARAEVKQVEAELVKARWKLDNCTIRAPITGTILKKNAEEGNIVNPVAFNGSFSICDMADLSDLEVSLDIQERDVSRVYAGQRCKVRADAFSDRVYEGVVSRLMPIADRAKGAIPVRIKLTVPAAEEGVYLKPEMGAIVSFLSDGPHTKAAKPVVDSSPNFSAPPDLSSPATASPATDSPVVESPPQNLDSKN